MHIYLYSNSNFYESRGRFIEDSLAHEIYHYVQVHYYKTPIDQFSDFEEIAAVEVQTDFRDRFQNGLRLGRSICEMLKGTAPQ
ncbi:MAG: hypothetical protein ACK5Y2_03315 [Bdellovibrionales bacterium]